MILPESEGQPESEGLNSGARLCAGFAFLSLYKERFFYVGKKTCNYQHNSRGQRC